MAMEALALAAVQHNFLYKYMDDPSYTKPAPFTSTSPLELFEKMRNDERLGDMFKEPGFANFDTLFEKHEDLVLEYWNAWTFDDPVKQFRGSQEAAVAFLVASVPSGTHSYNFFVCHVLTTSHAVRILLPRIPERFHIGLVRQWWLMAIAVYLIELRPNIDYDNIRPGDVAGKQWDYVEHQALSGPYSTDAHFVKGKLYLLANRIEPMPNQSPSRPRNEGGSAHLGRCAREIPISSRAVCGRFPGLESLTRRACVPAPLPPFAEYAVPV